MPPRPDVSAASAAKGTTRNAIGSPSVASPRNATPWTIASMSAPGVESEIGEFVRAAAPRTSTTTMTSLEIAMAVRISPIRRNHDAVFGQSRPESPSGKNAVVTRISTVRIASSSHSTERGERGAEREQQCANGGNATSANDGRHAQRGAEARERGGD